MNKQKRKTIVSGKAKGKSIVERQYKIQEQLNTAFGRGY